MFTGIVTDIGRVRRVVPAGQGAGDMRLEIACAYDPATIAIGASIACAGCCLTAIEVGGKPGDAWFAVQASAETLSKTTLGRWREGTRVNLERALKMGDELGGHIVSGHVDGLAALASRAADGDSARLVFALPKALGRFVAPKGSVTVEGVSLTVNEVRDAGGPGGSETRFGVNIIPHTQAATTLGALEVGQQVNVEIDMLARYVQRLAETAGNQG
ncbi:MAG: riboflavin synthase [Rhodospirillales bacterium]|nr:riboflavin synthase [Rhodospirillales bacterium]